MEVFEAHLGEFGDNHVDNLVTAAEMVVEGDGHAVLETRAADSLLEGDNLAVFLLVVPAEHAVLGFLSLLIYCLAHFTGLGGNCCGPVFQCAHLKFLL